MRGRRHGSDLFGLGPGERKKTSARSPLHASFARTGSLGASAMDSEGGSRGRAAMEQWWRAKREEESMGGRLGFIGVTMSVWEEGETNLGAVKWLGWRSTHAAKRRQEVTPVKEGKKKKRRGKGSFPFAKMGKGEGGRERVRQREEELCLHPLEASAQRWGWDHDDGDDGGGRYGAERLQGGRRGHRQHRADGVGDWPVGHHGARVREATVVATIWTSSVGNGADERGIERERERESSLSAQLGVCTTRARGEGGSVERRMDRGGEKSAHRNLREAN